MSLFRFIIYLILQISIYSSPKCEVPLNHCHFCNPVTNLCSKCDRPEIFIPDDEGGCIGAKQCYPGKNFCNECDNNLVLCKQCEINYYPDNNGGCAYTEGCEISYKGECLQCDSNYILIGQENNIKICKFLLNESYKNCESINTETGFCEKCEEGFFLNSEYKCTKVEFCKESIYGNCYSCTYGYYYDKKEDKCISKSEKDDFFFCKQTLDGKNCDVCDDGFHFDGKGYCVPTKYCLESENLICKKCISGYYLADNNCCSFAEHCNYVDVHSFVCTFCNKNYYLDTNDLKCKSNLEDNEFKYCKKASDGKCIQCENNYYLGEDDKCSDTKNCLESENGICLICSENYYLGLDKYCSNVENCIYSFFGECVECKDGYYYNRLNDSCSKSVGDFENCQISCYYEDECCECRNNFYLNLNNSKCYDNTKDGPFYKCIYSDEFGEKCEDCMDGYYIGSEDFKCSKIEDCKISENENKCLECDDNYCLDLKNQKCVYNNYIEDENNLFFVNCKFTNEDGTKCETCIDGYEIGEEGLCIDNNFCEEKNEEGICLKCKEKTEENDTNYCLNEIFGCMENRINNCLRCDNLQIFYQCTECKEGYNLINNYKCELIQDENQN